MCDVIGECDACVESGEEVVEEVENVTREAEMSQRIFCYSYFTWMDQIDSIFCAQELPHFFRYVLFAYGFVEKVSAFIFLFRYVNSRLL